MSEEHAFVEQIREDPHDDMPRLIYADYLEDAGEPQGELIRVQVELASLPVGDPRRIELVRREQALLDEHGEAWLAPLRELGAEGVSVRCFQRGLIERVKIAAGRFLETAGELCRIAPALYSLELRDAADAADRLAAMEMPPQITALDLSAKRLRGEKLQTLLGAPWFDRIEQLDLQANRLGDEGVRILTQRELPRLARLSLDINQLGPDAAAVLADWPSLARLTRLSLSVNNLSDVGAQRLADSRYLARLERLDLASNGIGSHGARRIARASSFHALRELNLRANRIDAEGMRRIIHADWAKTLVGIDIRGNTNEAESELQNALPDAARALS